MWVTAEYEATALFSLKPASATSSGGRTLLVPTPFAIKMAILNVVCLVDGVGQADDVCEWLSGASVALNPPQDIVVNNTFIKILKPRRRPENSVGGFHAGAYGKTIAYREYAQLAQSFQIAIEVEQDAHSEALRRWLPGINYLGKRGGFMQIQDVPDVHDTLSDAFIVIDGDVAGFNINSVMTQLDDTGASTGFERFNVYSGKRINMGTQRILHHVALPYELVSSSRGYSHYRRNRDDST
jgi:hypothetical protein